jgi:tRNA (cytidine/uridine-2'-O-)-methyltransferase
MDYGQKAVVFRHDGWEAFLESRRRTGGRLVLFSTRGTASLQGFAFGRNDCLLFGRESAGVPEEVHAKADAVVRIPLAAGARSLNVAMAAGVALWEALRQTGDLPDRQD